MGAAEWTIIAVFVATQVCTLGGVIIAMYISTRILKFQMNNVQVELQKLNEVIITQVGHGMRINQIDERLVLTGKRLDNLGERLNKFVDAKALG